MGLSNGFSKGSRGVQEELGVLVVWVFLRFMEPRMKNHFFISCLERPKTQTKPGHWCPPKKIKVKSGKVEDQLSEESIGMRG